MSSNPLALDDYSPSEFSSFWEQLFRANIRSLKPYSSARDEYQGEKQGIIFLDANESPKAALDWSGLNRYPDPQPQQLRELIAESLTLDSSQVLITHGSDEAIDLLLRACCEPKRDSIAICPPTYGMYQVAAAINDIEVLRFDQLPNFEIDLEKLILGFGPELKLVFISRPNNPTGNVCPLEVLLQIVHSPKFTGLLVIDEAYIEFCPENSAVDLLRRYKNVAIMRTFSKARALAGLRVGYLIGATELIATLQKVKMPYNLSSLTQTQALTAWKEDRVDARVAEIVAERKALAKTLSELPRVTVYHSEANFLLVRFPKAKEVFAGLRKFGVVVRDRSSELHCENCLRITIGTKAENFELLSEIKKLQSDEEQR